LAQRVEEAAAAYRKLRAQAPQDENIDGMRMLYLVQNFIEGGKLPEALTMLHLTAEFHPELIKQMQTTLTNEVNTILQNPQVPQAAKQQIKDSFNGMMKKLGLKEI